MGLGRSAIYSIHGILLFISLILIMAGMLSSRWQEMQFKQSGDIHHHGLFEDCTYAYREDQQGTWLCTFKDFSHPTYYQSGYGAGGGSRDFAYNAQMGHHDNAWWRVEIISLITCACFLYIIALIFAFCACCMDRADQVNGMKLTSIVALVCEILALLLAGAGVIYFTRMAYEPQFRTAVEAGQTVREQQSFGVSFYITVVGCVIDIISVAIGALGAVLAFMANGKGRTYYGGGIGTRVVRGPPPPMTVVKPMETYVRSNDVITTTKLSDPYETKKVPAEHPVYIATMQGSPQAYRSRNGSFTPV